MLCRHGGTVPLLMGNDQQIMREDKQGDDNIFVEGN